MHITIRWSDRKRARRATIIDGMGVEAALRDSRRDVLTLRQDNWSTDGSCATYQAAIQTGRRAGGCTPYRNIYALVEVVS